MNYERKEDNGYAGLKDKTGKFSPENAGADVDRMDRTLDKLSELLDQALVSEAMVLSELFQTTAKAAALLPDMELHTEVFHVVVDGASILVEIDRPEGTTEKEEDDDVMDYGNEYHSCQARDREYEEDDWSYEDDEEREYYED